MLDSDRVGECAYVCEHFSVVVVREDFRYLIRVLVVVAIGGEKVLEWVDEIGAFACYSRLLVDVRFYSWHVFR